MSRIYWLIITLLLAAGHFPCCALSPTDTIKAPRSGGYSAMEVAYDPETKLVTGYYSDEVGWNEQAKAAQYSCNFYLFGYWDGSKAAIHTFYPADTADDAKGALLVAPNGSIVLCLESDHGGCFGHTNCDSPPHYGMDNAESWIQLRYVDAEKSWFHASPDEKTKLKSYVTRGDILHISEIKGTWAHARYGGKKVTEGWIKLADLNSVKW